MLSTVFWVIFFVCFRTSLSEFIPLENDAFFVSKESTNWTDARQACLGAGLELVSILTEKEADTLEEFLKKNKLVPADEYSGFWLSAIRYRNGTFYWDSTGTEVGLESYRWLLGQPSNDQYKEHCMEFKWNVYALGWNSHFCAEKRRYLCQKSRVDGSKGQPLGSYEFLTEENPNPPEKFYHIGLQPVTFPTDKEERKVILG